MPFGWVVRRMLKLSGIKALFSSIYEDKGAGSEFGHMSSGASSGKEITCFSFLALKENRRRLELYSEAQREIFVDGGHIEVLDNIIVQ
ncbi:hypothetical protein TNCT_205261 [Trichonephila clavata]|uniref:Uncharacterized protein n=1 Tax=Trichonephila clavata TaxID=2740835 RepID=A0A8X6J803_TRICU|nr:hypothetical protein TNCT_205261 [Trichonephila clavata]